MIKITCALFAISIIIADPLMFLNRLLVIFGLAKAPVQWIPKISLSLIIDYFISIIFYWWLIRRTQPDLSIWKREFSKNKSDHLRISP